MQSANRLQKALRKHGPSFGVWQMLPGANLSRTIAQSGVDWICVDTEHGNIDDAAMHECVGAIAATGASPMVRVAANEGWLVKRALDSGAHGIIVPLLSTADDARRLVAAAKFPPQGSRGFGSPFPMAAFGGQTATEYLQQANDALLTVVQIETKEALENVDAIASVPGVDVLFVGPFDLGNSIGHPILDGKMHETLKDAIRRIHEAAVAHGKRSGIYCVSGEQAREYADYGFQMISIAADVAALSAYLSATLGVAKGSFAHATLNLAKAAIGGASKMTGSSGR